MDADERAAVVGQLGQAFGSVRDVSPAPDQPLHVLLGEVVLAGRWSPNPIRALVVFANWPSQRPEFYIDHTVVNGEGQQPRSNSTHYVVGESWLGYSWSFPWTEGSTPVRAVEKWLARFTEPT